MDHQRTNHALPEHLKLSTMSCSTRCSLAVLDNSCGAMGRRVRRLQGRILYDDDAAECRRIWRSGEAAP